jgi:hypothetical protein
MKKKNRLDVLFKFRLDGIIQQQQAGEMSNGKDGVRKEQRKPIFSSFIRFANA